MTPETLLIALDRFSLRGLSRDVEPREDDTWGVIDTKTADPETNWPGELVSEHKTHHEARLGLMQAILEAAALASPRADSDERTKGVDDPDVAYQRGKEDGYSEGVLDAAARAGLTLEYGASSDPERHVPGPVEVLARIAEHEDVRRWRDEDTRQLATAAAEAASLRAEVEAKDRALAEIVRIYDGPEINPVAAERMGKIARTALGSAATTETAKSWPRAPQPFLKRGYDSLWIAEWRAKTGGALGEAKKAHNEALRVARAATAREGA